MNDSAPANGRVIANFGRRVLVQDEHDQQHLCIPKGRKLGAVCGDNVVWSQAKHQDDFGIVESVLPRTVALERPSSRGRVEVLAANMTQLLIVVCHNPPLDPYLIDRYLAAGELMQIQCRVVWNKIDALTAQQKSDYEKVLQEFSNIGYDVLSLSAKTQLGLPRLSDSLKDHVSIMVGQSGVGKSSILNAILPNLEVATQEVSTANKEGKHTTTASRLYDLEAGGAIIDSPGIRDYAPAPVEVSKIQYGFREFALAEPCRFSDCTHLREPNCGVVAGVEQGLISPRRYESYRRLCNIMKKLQSNT